MAAKLTCRQCGREIGFLGSLLGPARQTGRCTACESHVQVVLVRFRQALLAACDDGLLTPVEWSGLTGMLAMQRVELEEALAFVRGDSLAFLERSLTIAAADGIITDEEERRIHRLRRIFHIPDALAQPVLDRMAYLRRISEVRTGKLPTVAPTIHLDADESCHMEAVATYRKVTAKAMVPVPGRLIVTSKQVHFVSPEGGWVIKLKSILRVEQDVTGVYLELSTKKGNGKYLVHDALLTEAVITTLVRIDRRQLVTPADDERITRHIPHPVKIAVWQRDQGKCVQCGATSYLEYDHIIPHSKGGANTVGNVQLLCRRCNLAKSDSL